MRLTCHNLAGNRVVKAETEASEYWRTKFLHGGYIKAKLYVYISGTLYPVNSYRNSIVRNIFMIQDLNYNERITYEYNFIFK